MVRGVVAVAEVEDLSALPASRLHAADAIVFPSRRRFEPMVRDWLAGARTLGCAPGALASGEELIAAVRPFAAELPGITVRLDRMGPDSFSGSFPSAASGWVSFLLTVPRDGGVERHAELRMDGSATRLIWLRTTRERDQHLSERFAIGTGEQRVTLTLSPPSVPSARRQRPPQAKLLRWRLPGSANGAAPPSTD